MAADGKKLLLMIGLEKISFHLTLARNPTIHLKVGNFIIN